jgi:hypothetical protein
MNSGNPPVTYKPSCHNSHRSWPQGARHFEKSVRGFQDFEEGFLRLLGILEVSLGSRCHWGFFLNTRFLRGHLQRTSGQNRDFQPIPLPRLSGVVRKLAAPPLPYVWLFIYYGMTATTHKVTQTQTHTRACTCTHVLKPSSPVRFCPVFQTPPRGRPDVPCRWPLRCWAPCLIFRKFTPKLIMLHAKISCNWRTLKWSIPHIIQIINGINSPWGTNAPSQTLPAEKL